MAADYISIHETPYFIGENGVVLSEGYTKVPTELCPLGRPCFDYRNKRFYLQELVLRYHGNPPEQCRNAEVGEQIRHLDGDLSNCDINNLQYYKKEQPKLERTEVIDLVADLVKANAPYKRIQEEALEKLNVILTTADIALLKKRFVTK